MAVHSNVTVVVRSTKMKLTVIPEIPLMGTLNVRVLRRTFGERVNPVAIHSNVRSCGSVSE